MLLPPPRSFRPGPRRGLAFLPTGDIIRTVAVASARDSTFSPGAIVLIRPFPSAALRSRTARSRREPRLPEADSHVSSSSVQAIALVAAFIGVGIAVLVAAVYFTVRLLRAGRGALAAAAFAVFLAWIPLSFLALFFMSMFGSAHVAAMHAHDGAQVGEAFNWARGLGIGYPVVGLLVLWGLFRLGRAAGSPPGAR